MAATMNVIDENAVAAFQENLAAKRAEFDEWAQSQIANARVMVDDHNDTMAKLQADTKTLQEHEKKYRVKAESLHTVLDSERKEIEKIVEQLDELRSEESCLPPVVDSLRTEVSKEKAQLQSIQKKAHRQKALRDYKMKELAQGLDCYRSRLGLDFRGLQENELQFTFTKIDPQHQEREFSFVIFIRGENDYDLIKCSPDFPGSRNCLKHLNQTGDLTKFICMMRLGFRQIVTKP